MEGRVKKLYREGDRVRWQGETVLGTVIAVGAHAVRVKWDDGVENSTRLDQSQLSVEEPPARAKGGRCGKNR